MHEDFIGRGNDVSYDFYRRMFEKENIGFGIPSSDECNECLSFEKHKTDIGMSDHESASCDICQKFGEHSKKAKQARERYREDMKKPTGIVLTCKR